MGEWSARLATPLAKLWNLPMAYGDEYRIGRGRMVLHCCVLDMSFGAALYLVPAECFYSVKRSAMKDGVSSQRQQIHALPCRPNPIAPMHRPYPRAISLVAHGLRPALRPNRFLQPRQPAVHPRAMPGVDLAAENDALRRVQQHDAAGDHRPSAQQDLLPDERLADG